jgi:large subunit ribosomal protein L22
MPGPKLNEHPVLRRRPNSRAEAVEATPSARAVSRYVRISPYKIRVVLDLVRGHNAEHAQDILRLCERDAATVVGKALASAISNAERNNAIPPEELYLSACFADEGPTLKRWRPRARGRATRIRKRTCHVTVIVSRLPDRELSRRREQFPASDERRRRRAGQESADQVRRRRRVRGEASTASEEAVADVVADEQEAAEMASAIDEAIEPAAAPDTEAEVAEDVSPETESSDEESSEAGSAAAESAEAEPAKKDDEE